MPNWCSNDVTIWGLHEQPAKDLVRAAKAGNLLNWIAPMPKKLEGTSPGKDDDNWWDWRWKKWGTKWDVQCYHVDFEKPNGEGEGYTIELSFDSAWSPPFAAFEILKEHYPEIDVDHYYFEPGNDFVGCNGDDYSPYEIYQQHKTGEFVGYMASELADRFGFLQDYYDYDDEEEEKANGTM